MVSSSKGDTLGLSLGFGRVLEIADPGPGRRAPQGTPAAIVTMVKYKLKASNRLLQPCRHASVITMSREPGSTDYISYQMMRLVTDIKLRQNTQMTDNICMPVNGRFIFMSSNLQWLEEQSLVRSLSTDRPAGFASMCHDVIKTMWTAVVRAAVWGLGRLLSTQLSFLS